MGGGEDLTKTKHDRLVPSSSRLVKREKEKNPENLDVLLFRRGLFLRSPLLSLSFGRGPKPKLVPALFSPSLFDLKPGSKEEEKPHGSIFFFGGGGGGGGGGGLLD